MGPVHEAERRDPEVPDSPLAGDFHAINMVSMLIRQKAGFKGNAIAHELSNLTGIRPWKL